MTSSTSVADVARPTGSAPLGARHRCRLQTRCWTLSDPPVGPPGGPPSTSSSNSVVDATGPTGCAPKGPANHVIFNLGGGRCRTRRQRPPGARHPHHFQTRWWTLPDPPIVPPGGPPSMSSSNSVVDAARLASSAPRGPAIDVVFKLGRGRCPTNQQCHPGGLPSASSLNSVVDAAGPGDSATKEARHRCRLQPR
jgi:hypothetical protein